MDEMEDTAQRLCRNAFDEQYTEDMVEALTCAVENAIGKLQRVTPWRNRVSVDDRIHTAVLKTLDGTRAWDPARWSLFVQLYQAVRSEVSAEIEHQLEVQPKMVDDSKLQLVANDRTASEVLASDRATRHEAASDYCSMILDELRKLAAKDKGVLKLLDMYSDGVFERAEIMRRTKMSARTYGTVYQRFMRLAKQIDDELREAVVDALAN